MTLILKQFFGLLKLLNSETGSSQIAAGVSVGLILGFSPILSLQALAALGCIFFFRVQIGAALMAAFFFKLVAWLFDPLCHALGSAVLETEALRPLFTAMYNMPLVPLTRFNNSIVMGSGIISLALAVPTFFAAKWLIAKYRATVVARIKGTKFWRALKATSLFKWYATYSQFR
jgi:uncharacterized protein (TIGR03546 family)